MGVIWTEEQQKVISLRNRNILVVQQQDPEKLPFL